MNKEWLKTSDGSYTLYRKDLDEIYHSRSGALSECHHVYLKPFLEHQKKHPTDHWRVLDIGFGLGFNGLCYVDHLFKNSVPKSMDILSVENDSSLLDLKLEQKHLGSHQFHDEVLQQLAHLKKDHLAKTDHLSASLMLGELEVQLDQLIKKEKVFDVILHDPFAPEKNPECWTPEIFQKIALCSHPKTVLLTYSVSAKVRTSLQAAGFSVTKTQGFASKREQLVAFYVKER